MEGSAISVSDSSAVRLPPSGCDRLEAYEAPHNLPLSAYAVLARKSCEQIIGDIKARRLLAFSLDDRGYRIPDWQLDPTKYLLTLTVLTLADQADAWEVYWALSRSMGRWGSRAPLEAVTSSTILEVGEIVCASLREQRLDA